MNSKLSLLLALSVAAGASFGAIRAVTPTAWDGGNTNCWQQHRHADKLKEVAAGGAKVVFIGDSITHFWESNGKAQLQRYFSQGELKMLDLGTSADRTEHVLWRLDHGELDGYEAKCVLLMIGTNNAGHFPFAQEPPTDAILGIRAILQRIRAKQPQAIIVLTAIFPRGAEANDPCRLRNDIVNREIRRFCDGKTILWCDLAERFLQPDGKLPKEVFPDFLHPNAAGYEIWYEGVKPYIDYALSDRSGPVPPELAVPVAAPALPAARVAMTRIRNEGYGKPDWWLDRLLEKRNQIAEAKGEIDLVLLGDSITHNWERQGAKSLAELRKTYSVLDIGYSGDRTEHVLWRAENGELDGYRAKCIMLMIGTNNTWHRRDRPEDIAAGIRDILAVIARKQPQAKVLLLPIFPIGDGPAEARRVNNDQVNALIREYADGDRVRYLDFNAQFLDANGDTRWIMPDRVHPNAAGYELWRKAIEPQLKEIVGK